MYPRPLIVSGRGGNQNHGLLTEANGETQRSQPINIRHALNSAAITGRRRRRIPINRCIEVADCDNRIGERCELTIYTRTLSFLPP